MNNPFFANSNIVKTIRDKIDNPEIDNATERVKFTAEFMQGISTAAIGATKLSGAARLAFSNPDLEEFTTLQTHYREFKKTIQEII